MKPLFSRNIISTGNLVRALGALVLLIEAGFSFLASVWRGAGLAVSSVFVLFEVLRGWYVLHACGIKTRL